MRNTRRGYTLFELVLVVAILAILAALIAPTIQSLAGATPLNAAADTVKARMADARARAMAENRPYRFDVMENTNLLRVAPDSEEFWQDGGGTPVSIDQGQPAFVVDDKLPKEVRFCTPEGLAGGQAQVGTTQGGWMCSIVFLPNGTTRQDAEIAFSQQGGRPLVLRVKAATGAVTTAR